MYVHLIGPPKKKKMVEEEEEDEERVAVIDTGMFSVKVRIHCIRAYIVRMYVRML